MNVRGFFIQAMNKVQTTKAILFKEGVKTKSIEIETTEEKSIGEVLIGELYAIGSFTSVGVVTDESVIVDPHKTTLTIDVTGINPGTYGLKIYTSATGVIARNMVTII